MIVVSNSTPLIALSAIGQFSLLQSLYSNMAIPEAVYDEVVIAGAGKSGSQEVANAVWISKHIVLNQQAVTDLLNQTKLQIGESEAIILAQELNADLLILDDNNARKEAKTRNVSVTGTVGILLLAKQQGLIAVVKSSLDALLQSGFRLSTTTYQATLKLAGE